MRLLRGILKAILLICALGIGLFLYAGFLEPRLLTRSEYTIQAPAQVPDCKIVYFSDTHFGKMYTQKNIEKIVNKINAQSPDLVLFGGDFLDNYARDIQELDLEYLSSWMGRIQSRYGNYAVFGNHDHGGGAVRIYEEFMENSGFTVLQNENVFIQDLNLRLIGYDDYLLGETDPALYDIQSEDYNLILSHEPDVVQSLSMNQPGIMMAGHSHGGQVNLPYITDRILPEGGKQYVKGLYENTGKNENISLYVSKGIGMTVIPFRLFSPPEIMVLKVQ